jgi:hypothetical protein
MMLPPDDWAGDAVPHDVPRGTCASCGSDEVVHLVIGMPASAEAWGSGPDWVNWVGCVHPGWDRECRRCGACWSVHGGRPVVVLLLGS